MPQNLLYADETYQIRGVIFNVYNRLGPEHEEKSYEEALKIAFDKHNIPFHWQKSFDVVYENHRVGMYRPDLIAFEKILLELKALEKLFPIHEAQTLSYLRVTNLKLALLVNFGAAEVQIMRRILTQTQRRNEPPERNKPYSGGFEHLPYPELAWVIGNCICRVHFTLGPGFLFHVYENALAIEMMLQGIDFQRVKYLDVEYEGQTVGRDRVHLLIADEKMLIAPVTVRDIQSVHLKTTRKQMDKLGLHQGIVVNFHNTKQQTRIVRIR